MAINDTVPSITYEIGASSDGPFAIPFEFYADADLLVYLFDTGTDPEDGELLTLTTDYTVTGAADDAGGELTLVEAVASKSIKIERNTQAERLTDIPQVGPLIVTALNAELDRQLAIDQETKRDLTHAIRARSALDLLPADRSAGGVVGFAAGAPNTPVLYSIAAGATVAVTVTANTMASLQATSAAVIGNSVVLLGRLAVGDGGGGFFYWSSGNNSANVTADPRKGIYIPPSTDLTGASGAWVRVFEPGRLNLGWFGTDADADAGDLISDVLVTAGSLEHRTVFIPDGDWTLATPIVPKSDITVIGSPKARLIQTAATAVANPSGTALRNFKLLGPTFVYDHASPKLMHSCLALGSHQYCEIDIKCDDYTDQILHFIKTTDSGALSNTVANKWTIRTEDQCGIGVWYQGLETNYTEAEGTGAQLDVTTTFNVKWPADLLVTRFRESTGTLIRLVYPGGYTITSGAAGVSGTATVRPVTNLPVGDKLMIWPARASGPLKPISNNDLHLWLQDVSRATVYAVRYVDSERITGHARLNTDGAAHIWTNPAGLWNAETDYFNFQAPVFGQSAPTTSTVHVLRLGPGTTRTMGAIQMDSAWGAGDIRADDFTDRERVTLTGTVTTTGANSIITGAGTSFTTEVPFIGAGTPRIRFVDDGATFAIVSVDSNTQITVSGTPDAYAGATIQVDDPPSGISYSGLSLSHFGAGGNAPPVTANRKSGTFATGQAAIAGGATSVIVDIPHTLVRQPHAGEIMVTPHSDIGSGNRYWVEINSPLRFTIHCGAAAAGSDTYGYSIQLEDFE
jgi:hypothetical protein